MLVDTLTEQEVSVEKKRWNILKTTRGYFKNIPKEQLLVDPAYQRSHNGHSRQKVQTFVKNWSWEGCHVLSVAHRGDKLYVMDGSHRLAAAMMIPEIKNLPCLIFEVEDSKTEAENFLRLNVLRKPVTSSQKHHAKVHVGDGNSILIEEWIASVGRYVSSNGGGSPKTVTNVAAMEEAIKVSPESAEAAFFVTASLCEGRSYSNEVFSGLALIDYRLRERNTGRSITDKEIVARLKKIGLDDILLSIRQAKGFLGVGGNRARAIGIQNIFNRGLRSNKIEVAE